MIEAERAVEEFEEQAGVEFQDKSYLQRAFVHRSYLNEADDSFGLSDNERLEFLGDAVLSFVTSELLYNRFPNALEGELTSLRAALVRRETLARFAASFRLGEYLLLGHGEEDSGGRTRPATLCATFEAVVGALYMDQGIDAVRSFLAPMLDEELNRVAGDALSKDPKSRLQEWVQSEMGVTPRYKTISTIGPDHARTFVVQVTANKHPIGLGRGRSKQEAAQLAAAMALHRFGQLVPEYKNDDALENEYPLPPLPQNEDPSTAAVTGQGE